MLGKRTGEVAVWKPRSYTVFVCTVHVMSACCEFVRCDICSVVCHACDVLVILSLFEKCFSTKSVCCGCVCDVCTVFAMCCVRYYDLCVICM